MMEPTSGTDFTANDFSKSKLVNTSAGNSSVPTFGKIAPQFSKAWKTDFCYLLPEPLMYDLGADALVGEEFEQQGVR